MPPDSFQYESLRAESQRTLIEFLRAELNIGAAFAQSAVLAKDSSHHARAKADANKAAESVRRFMGQIADAEVRAEIGNKLAELDQLISTL